MQQKNHVTLPLSISNIMYFFAFLGILFGSVPMLLPMIMQSLLQGYAIGDDVLWKILWIGCLVELVVMLFPSLILLACEKEMRPAYRLARPNAPQTVLVILIALCAVVISIFLANIWGDFLLSLGGQIPEESFPTPANIGQLLQLVFLVAIIPAFAEEFLFRGALLGAYERLGKMPALLLSSLLFSCMHGSLPSLPSHLFLGLILGIVVLETGSIWSGVLVHFINNALAMLFDYWHTQPLADNAFAQLVLLINEGDFSFAPFLPLVALIGLAISLLGLTRQRAPYVRPIPESRHSHGAWWLLCGAGMLMCMALYLFSLFTTFSRAIFFLGGGL